MPGRPPWIPVRNDFSYSERNNFSYFYQVTQMLPTKFQVNWSFGLEKEAKTIFSRWPSWWPSWISDRNHF